LKALKRLQHGNAWILARARELHDARWRAGAGDHHVGERAADIDADRNLPARHWPARTARRSRTPCRPTPSRRNPRTDRALVYPDASRVTSNCIAQPCLWRRNCGTCALPEASGLWEAGRDLIFAWPTGLKTTGVAARK